MIKSRGFIKIAALCYNLLAGIKILRYNEHLYA